MKTYEAQCASEMFCLLVDGLSKPPLDVMRAISKVQHTGTASLADTVISAWKDSAGDDHFRAVRVD
jgi:hypothetical protein